MRAFIVVTIPMIVFVAILAIGTANLHALAR